MSKKRYIKLDLGGRMTNLVFNGLYAGLHMIMHHEVEWAKKHNETAEPGEKVFSLVAGEAYTTICDLKIDFPDQMAQAKEWFEKEYPQYLKQPTK